MTKQQDLRDHPKYNFIYGVSYIQMTDTTNVQLYYDRGVQDQCQYCLENFWPADK